MDYIIASLHTPCIANLGIVKNTAALVGAAENLNVTVIGHPDDDRYPIDPDEVAAAAVALMVFTVFIPQRFYRLFDQVFRQLSVISVFI